MQTLYWNLQDLTQPEVEFQIIDFLKTWSLPELLSIALAFAVKQLTQLIQQIFFGVTVGGVPVGNNCPADVQQD